MRRPTPRVVRYHASETSKYVVEGLRVGGKRTRKFFPTRRAGDAWLRKTLARISQEGEGAIHMPERLRVEAVAMAAKLKPYGATLTQAVEHFIAHRAAVARSCTVAELRAEFLSALKKRGKRDLYLKDLRNRLARFELEFADRTIAEVRGPEIGDWLDDLDVAAQTRKNFRTVLKTFFEFAVSREYAAENPVEKGRNRRG